LIFVSLAPDIEHEIPENRQEETILPTEGAKFYEEEMIKCHKFSSVSIRVSSTYLVDYLVGLISSLLQELAEQAASRALGLQQAGEGL